MHLRFFAHLIQKWFYLLFLTKDWSIPSVMVKIATLTALVSCILWIYDAFVDAFINPPAPRSRNTAKAKSESSTVESWLKAFNNMTGSGLKNNLLEKAGLTTPSARPIAEESSDTGDIEQWGHMRLNKLAFIEGPTGSDQVQSLEKSPKVSVQPNEKKKLSSKEREFVRTMTSNAMFIAVPEGRQNDISELERMLSELPRITGRRLVVSDFSNRRKQVSVLKDFFWGRCNFDDIACVGFQENVDFIPHSGLDDETSTSRLIKGMKQILQKYDEVIVYATMDSSRKWAKFLYLSNEIMDLRRAASTKALSARSLED